MKFTRFVIGAFALLLLLPLRAAAENIAVDPMEWDYGEVEVGDSVEMSFTIESTGPTTPLLVKTIVVVDDATESFGVAQIPVSLPHSLPVGETLEAVVTFAPTEEGEATANLFIESDSLLEPILFLPLEGQGVVNEPPPGELMEEVIAFFEAGVADYSIFGLGNGNSPAAHLRVFAGMLDSIDDLIEAGDLAGACDKLAQTSLKSDGAEPPPDFVGGSSVGSLHAMLLEVMDVLGCE